MRAYRSSEAGLTAFLLWAETNDMVPTEEMLRVGVERGWFTPEEVDVDEVQHLRRVVALYREEAAGAQRHIAALEAKVAEREAALLALLTPDPVAYTPTNRVAFCPHCGGGAAYDGRRYQFSHEPDCPVLVARALLKPAEET